MVTFKISFLWVKCVTIVVECSVLCQFDHQSTPLFEKVKKGIGENDLFSSLLGSL